jgi:hypothetical protein
VIAESLINASPGVEEDTTTNLVLASLQIRDICVSVVDEVRRDIHISPLEL